jgi:hypothetical protein
MVPGWSEAGAAYQHTFGKRRRFQPSPPGTRASARRRFGLGAARSGSHSCARVLGSAALCCSSSMMAGRALSAARLSRSRARSAPARLLVGVRRRLGAGSVGGPSRFSTGGLPRTPTGRSEGRTRPLRVGASGAAGGGSARLGAKLLEAKSPRLVAVASAWLAVLNTRLAAAKGVSSPALAGASSFTSRLGTSSGAGSSISLPPFSSER